MARPRKKKSDLKNAVLRITCTPDLHKSIMDYCEEIGEDFATWARRILSAEIKQSGNYISGLDAKKKCSKSLV